MITMRAKNHTEPSFLYVADIMELFGCSRSKAYQIIAELNRELEKKGEENNMSMREHCTLIMTCRDMQDRDNWLAMREHGIGGSEAASIVGLNPWKSPYQLWLEKTGQVEPEDISGKETVHFGTKLEQLVADEFCERERKRVRRSGMYKSKGHPYMLGSFDRLLVGEDAGLECKTCSAFKRKKWDEGEVPSNYYVQCQHYMAVSGLPRWYIACLVGGNHFVCWTIERDEDDIAALEAAESAFWKRVQNRIPPAVDGSESCTEALRERFKGGQVEPIELPSKASKLINRYDELKTVKGDIDTQIKEVQNQLCEMLGDNEIGIAGTGEDAREVKWKVVSGRTTIDSKRLKAEMPDVYDKYSKVGKPTRRFSL